MTKKARINQQMGQNNQKDQKGPKMTAAVMLVQNNQNNQKIWSSHICIITKGLVLALVA